MIMLVNKTKEEVLTLFLDIPENQIKLLYERCENFISNLQNGEEDEAASMGEPEQDVFLSY